MSLSARLFSNCLLAAAACATLSCASDPRRTEVDEAANEIVGRIHVVAFEPPTSATRVVTRERAAEVFVPRAAAWLEAAGFRVVGPEIWEEIWRRYAEDVGEVFDPSTGTVDEQRYDAVRDAVRRELAEVHGVDAQLRLFVDVDEAFGVSDSAEACGGLAAPYWPGGWKRAGNQAAMIVRVACLVAIVSDANGKELFRETTPIEGIETFDRQTRAVRPPEDVLQASDLLDRAIELVLARFKPTDRP